MNNTTKRLHMQLLVAALVSSGQYGHGGLARELNVTEGAVRRYARGESMGTNAQRARLAELCLCTKGVDLAKLKASGLDLCSDKKSSGNTLNEGVTSTVSTQSNLNEVKENPMAKQTTTEKPVPSKKVKQPGEKKETVGQAAMRLVLAKKNDEEIREYLIKNFSLPEKHYHYPGWYRGQVVRRGLMSKEEARKYAHGKNWKRSNAGGAAEKPAPKKKVAVKKAAAKAAPAGKKVTVKKTATHAAEPKATEATQPAASA